VAYCLGVVPRGAQIHRKLRELRDALVEAGSENAEFLVSVEGRSGGSTKWNRYLEAEREPELATIEFVDLVVSEDAADSFESCFLGNFENDTYDRLQQLVSSSGSLPVEPAWEDEVAYHDPLKDLPPKRTSTALINEFRRLDSTSSLRFFTTLFSVAHKQAWADLYPSAFDDAIDIACRLASVPPFETFGQAFMIDLFTSLLCEGRAVKKDWKKIVVRRLDEYRQLLQLARDKDAQLLSPTPSTPVGDRWKELAFLRFADEQIFLNLHAALLSRQCKGTEPDLYREAKAYIDAFQLPPEEDLRL
jgi:hypothetical protein